MGGRIDDLVVAGVVAIVASHAVAMCICGVLVILGHLTPNTHT